MPDMEGWDDEALDEWYELMVVRLKDKHKTQDIFEIPRDEWYGLQQEYKERLRILRGRDPKTGDKTPEQRAKERREAEPDQEPQAKAPEAFDQEAFLGSLKKWLG